MDKKPNKGIRCRIWIDGELKNEEWAFAAKDAKRIAEKHFMMSTLAGEMGSKFLVETFLPGVPEDQAYVRFGTDADGMVYPMPVMEDL